MTSSALCPYVPGDVLVLLSELQELEPGLYMVQLITDDWVTLRWLLDDEERERVLMLDRTSMLPVKLLDFFMPIGLRMTLPA